MSILGIAGIPRHRMHVHEKPVLFKYWLNNVDVIPDPSHVAPMPHTYTACLPAWDSITTGLGVFCIELV